ncbi:MAG TPA: fumarylacetoacetate hydrolase family protein [Opitutus sp.]|nr:fumarylacetoacetate hydrolase family protein [Opitutus sp.]
MTQLIRLYAADSTVILESAGKYVRAPATLTVDALFTSLNPGALAASAFEQGTAMDAPAPASLRAPLGSQEIWAAGVTYLRSKNARMEESKDVGGGTFYDRVYEADRPELFFKSTPHRTVGPGGKVRLRADSKWNVPEPELTLAVNMHGKIFGFTLGNDMSSRDIEGENPLYLPQAKVYDGSAALGPCIVITADLPPPESRIQIEIRRDNSAVFNGETTISQIKRPLPSLVGWLFRDQTFPSGCFLMTGTGIVPPDSFTLKPGDEIRITLDPVGTLINIVGS